MTKLNLIALGKFHYFDIAKLLSKNGMLEKYYTNDILYFSKNNKIKKEIKLDLICFFISIFSKLTGVKFEKYLHQNFPFNFKSENKILYSASLSLFKLINKKNFDKIIIDHGSPNLEYDKKITLREFKLFKKNINNFDKYLTNNWVINQENYEFSNSNIIFVPSKFSKKTFFYKQFYKNIFINKIVTNLSFEKKPKDYENQIKIIYVGDFSIRKGIHRLIKNLDMTDHNLSDNNWW